MATREDIIVYARSKIGVHENPAHSNCQEFSKVLGRPCEAWCGDFLVAVMRHFGIKLPSESAFTPTMFNGFQISGTAVYGFSKSLQPGDIVFYDFIPPFNTHGIQHTELFLRYVDAFTIETIGGNTSSGNAGSQDNGDGVYLRQRPLKFVVGSGRPAYSMSVPPTRPVVPLAPEEVLVAVTIPRPQGGYINIGKDGGVFSYRGAPFFGSLPGAGVHVGNAIGGAWTPSGNGYWLLTQDGAIFSFGDAVYRGGFNGLDPAVRGGRYAVGMATIGNGYVISTFDPSNDGSPFDEYAFGL